MESPTKADLEEKLGVLYQNLSVILEKLQKENQVYQEDSGNAYMYILFVLTFYAFSIVVLMVKYIRREREGSKLEFYYNEFVKRDWYKDKNLYDKTGRRIYYTVDQNNKVIKVARKSSRIICDDPEIDFFQADKIENSEEERKSPLILCVQPNSAISLNPK